MNGRACAVVLVSWIAACGARQSGSGDGRIEERFESAGVARVELRASDATAAEIVESPDAQIRVTGTAQGGAKITAADQKEIPASAWGMTFVSKRHGDTLVISTKGEVSDARQRYTVGDLVIAVPEGVQVDLVTRSLTANGAPDLSASGE